MNNIPKKQQIILAFLGLAIAAAVVWQFFLSPTFKAGSEKRAQLSLLQDRLDTAKRTIRSADAVAAQLKQAEKDLDQVLDKMVTGDKYLWVIRTMHSLKIPGSLEFTEFGEPQPRDWGYPADVPLPATSFRVKGVGYYKSLGAFMANLENDYPFLRFSNIEIGPTEPVKEEKVGFTFDIIALTSTNRVKGAEMQASN